MTGYLRGATWLGMAALATMGLAACNQNASAEGPQYATVVSTTPIKKTVNNPTQECHNEAVAVHKPVKDKHQLLGTAIGAVAGGLLGNQVGGGNGKKLATVAGAVAGGYAGHEVQEHHQENATETVNKRVCKTINHTSTKIVAYNVKYKYNGSVHTVRMDHDPGDKVQIKQDVKVVSGNG